MVSLATKQSQNHKNVKNADVTGCDVVLININLQGLGYRYIMLITQYLVVR